MFVFHSILTTGTKICYYMNWDHHVNINLINFHVARKEFFFYHVSYFLGGYPLYAILHLNKIFFLNYLNFQVLHVIFFYNRKNLVELDFKSLFQDMF